MALAASEIIASVRASLDYPDYGKLKQQLLVLKLKEKVDHYFNRMNLTDRNWFINSFTLTVVGNTESYEIAQTDWGRPLLVETADSTDPQHIRRVIPIMDLADRTQLYEGTVIAMTGLPLSNKHTATSVAIYKTPSLQNMIRFTPGPSQSADYIITYEPNRAAAVTFGGNVIFLEQFQNLLIADLALTCLPYCGYEEDVIETGNRYQARTKSDELRVGLMRDYALYAATFEEYIQNDRQQKTEIKKMWGDSIALQGDGWY